jgi:ATP-dependent DNA helicase RecG
LIDENYTNILYNHPELSLEDVILPDKVQKKQPLGETETARLRELKFVKGRATSLQIVGNAKPAGLSNKDYKQMILNLLTEKGSAQREDIEKLIMPLLPQNLPVEKRQKKISNLITDLSHKERKIKNISASDKYSEWTLIIGKD